MRKSAFVLLMCALAVFAQGSRRAPGFSLPDAQSRQHDLQDYRGKWVLIDVMKTECPHCVVFARILEKTKANYRNRLSVLSVVHPPDNPTTVAQFVAKNGITSPVLFDCGQMAFSYIRPNPLNPAIQIPHLFVINPQGFIVADWEYGTTTKDIFEGNGLEKELTRLIGKPDRSI